MDLDLDGEQDVLASFLVVWIQVWFFISVIYRWDASYLRNPFKMVEFLRHLDWLILYELHGWIEVIFIYMSTKIFQRGIPNTLELKIWAAKTIKEKFGPFLLLYFFLWNNVIVITLQLQMDSFCRNMNKRVVLIFLLLFLCYILDSLF